MRAHLGDQLVIESTKTSAARRDGEIVGLHHADGTPPYDVRWSDTDEVTLVFPGPDAHVHHLEHGRSGAGNRPSAPVPAETAASSHGPHPGDIGRRIAVERRNRDLSLEETARRARMSAGYLEYLEEHPGDPSAATLVKLADVLGTTVTALRGGGTDLPPGHAQVRLHPELRDIGPEECRTLLSTHGVGRIAVSAADGRLAVLPVNYDVVDDAIVFRTAPHSTPASAVGSEVAFEVDHMDEALRRGWSVLAIGPATVVTKPAHMHRLTEQAHTTPWAGGEREMWVSIRPVRLTGRRITPVDG
ncbi:DUF1918 domain-containing protein [Streptomyces sp. AK04-3B]|uniref:DUF1918 domain-containing protein n=1 Tax=unclassified Streptomyces TaxID=2593676 RepID=UPI0029AB3E62|nr:DUF1918 domain-containing protein [Streptomyces sp. AK04-3B]MDX3798088.1 DUF1918 domain-containing protein [Streptomyces sp. AK04-3B]